MSRVKLIRTNVFGLSQGQFGKLIGLSQQGISRLEERDALPEKHQRTIRQEARKLGIRWHDSWFFKPPVTAVQARPKQAAE